MKRTLIAALVATSAAIGFAGSAFAAPTLLYGSDANDHKSVQIINVPSANDGSYVAITSSHRGESALPAFGGNGKQLLILPDDRTDGTKRVFY